MKSFMNSKKLFRLGALLIGMLCLGMFTAPGFAAGSTFVVTNDLDSEAGSLRQAILEANANPGSDMIVFNIPGSGEVHTIQLQSLLPPITDPVFIDGSSQAGYSPSSPVIKISGSRLNLDFPTCQGPANGRYRDNAGLDIRLDPASSVDASGTTILGLIVSRFVSQ